MAGIGTAHLRAPEDALLRVEHLVVDFPVGRTGLSVQAVADVSFDVLAGETLGLVGESGCGKSTTGRAVVQSPPPTSGRVLLDGVDLCELRGEELRARRPDLQLILQDPISSLNPRRRVREIVAQPLRTWHRGDARGRAATVRSLLEAVGLDPGTTIDRRPHELSGGQCQRVGIARALALEPRMLICDEPVSALDVSVQGQVLNLLEDLKARYGLTIVFIAHDLAVVKSISDRVAVMYLGKLCEVGPVDTVYASPAHPYTDALLQSVPVPDPTVPPRPAPLAGELPSPLAPPSGCRFRTRCPRAQARCESEEPVMRAMGDGHFAACHFPLVVLPPVAGL
ncbi:MAG: transporter protein ATP-binding protein [Acidimicrobiales bacterium]|jgi:peptide/nickel transport system ATP-binding protein|nr:transporter protein ATP-binding protein [Acidimicrobiales bacterium]